MATREQLEKALRNAHGAGDTAAAQRFADEIRKLDSGPSKAQQDFDALPTYMKPVKALDDLLRVGSDALTFGGVDYLRTLAGTQPDIETARQATGEARERSGAAGDVTAAASALPLMMAMPALSVPASAGPVLAPLANTGLAALEGSAWGGLDALGHGRDVTEGQLTGAAFGAGGKVVSGLLGRGLDWAVEKATRGQRIEPRELRLAKDRAYNAMEDEQIAFRPSAVDDLIDRVDDVSKDAYPGVQNEAIAARNRAKKNLRAGGQGFRRNRTMTQIDKERQNFRRDVVNSPVPTNKPYGIDMISELDRWMDDAVNNPAAVSSRSGDAEKALGLLQEGRKLNQRVEKLDMLDERLGKARRQAERNLYSGEDSTIKQNIGGILDNPKLRDQFTPAEQAQMELINAGTGGQKILRQGGRAAPGGALMWPGVGAGAAVGSIFGPAGAVAGGLLAPMVGIASKHLSSRATRKSTEKLLDMVSSGKDLERMSVLGPKGQRDLARLLMSLGITSAED